MPRLLEPQAHTGFPSQSTTVASGEPDRRIEWIVFIASLLVADLITCLVAFGLAARAISQPGLGTHISSQYWVLILLFPPVAAGTFAVLGLYDPQNLLGGTREYAAVFRACTYCFIGLVVVGFAIRLPLSREWILLSWSLAVLLIGAVRFGLRRVAYRLRRPGRFTSRALLVGVDAQALALVRKLMQPTANIELVGVLDDYLPVGTMVGERLKVLGTSARLAEAARRTRAQEVIVVPGALPWESLQGLLRTAAGATRDGLRMHLLGGFYDLLTTGVRFSQPNGVPMLTVKNVALTTGEATLKRTVDIVFALVLLVLSAPVMALELLRLLSRGAPLFETQSVLDRRGQHFELLSLPADLVTRSELVRKLPSLFNVLVGQLSIVGPHPIPVDQGSGDTVRDYRFPLRPGLTGLWRQSRDGAEQLLLDLYYIRGYSLWLDMHILYNRVKAHLEIGPEAGRADELAMTSTAQSDHPHPQEVS